MIRNTLPSTSAATFSVLLPDPQKRDMPTPSGTGFFVSPDGWFMTAAHVVSPPGQPDIDMGDACLQKEPSLGNPSPLLTSLSLLYVDKKIDIALIKVNLEENKEKEWLKDRDEFQHLIISTRILSLGEPVYSFGYPLSSGEILSETGGVTIGSTNLCPRVTSAIISSTLEKTGVVMSFAAPDVYVLDKALNYGNSGGPIVASETGHVHAICARFQPVHIPQHHLKQENGPVPTIKIPSLYGVAASFLREGFQKKCAEYGIPVTDE